jgi:hypothetical protein
MVKEEKYDPFSLLESDRIHKHKQNTDIMLPSTSMFMWCHSYCMPAVGPTLETLLDC